MWNISLKGENLAKLNVMIFVDDFHFIPLDQWSVFDGQTTNFVFAQLSSILFQFLSPLSLSLSFSFSCVILPNFYIFSLFLPRVSFHFSTSRYSKLIKKIYFKWKIDKICLSIPFFTCRKKAWKNNQKERERERERKAK